MISSKSVPTLYTVVHQSFARKFSCDSSAHITTVQELRHHLLSYVSKLQSLQKRSAALANCLDPRHVRDSYDKVLLPLGSDKNLRESYLNALGYLRFGVLAENLDSFAAYRHSQGGSIIDTEPRHKPVALVTACVDRIDLHAGNLLSDRNIVMEGFVSWVGKSSMEVTINVSQERKDNEWSKELDARFVMVGLDPSTSRPVNLHPLALETPAEEKLFRLGEENRNIRKSQTEQSLFKVPPTESERLLLHELFLQTLDETSRSRLLPSGQKWMEDCRLKNLIICHPQKRNLYNKIFGGYLMRQAYELAWANAAVFSGGRPRTLSVDDIFFRKSVEVGSLLFLSSAISYTQDRFMEVRVHATMLNLETGKKELTNTFFFTFETSSMESVPKLMPKSYADGMLFLIGKRHFDESMHTRSDSLL